MNLIKETNNPEVLKPDNLKDSEIERMAKDLIPVAQILARRGVNLRITREDPTKSLYFDPRTRTCVINIAFLKARGLTGYHETLFGIAHEVGHFIQFLSDPKMFEYLYELIEKEAEKVTRYILNNPSLRDKIITDLTETQSLEEKEGSDEEILRGIFIEVYHELVNFLLDIHANTLIRARLVPFMPGQSHGDTPRDIYSRKLFPGEKGIAPDYSGLPLHKQFIFSLLRNFMTGEQAIVSEAIQEALGREIEYLGKKMSISDLSEEISYPKSNVPSLALIIKYYYLPIFDELLRKDLEEGRFRVIKLPVNLDEGYSERRKLIDEYRKVLERESKSARERSEEEREKLFKKASLEAGFTEKQSKELYEILHSVEGIMKRMNEIWYNFMRREISTELEKLGYFRYGTTIDILRIIREWSTITVSPQEADVFERYIPTEKIELIPRKIKICLVIDLSRSMNEAKRKAVQEITYAIIQSLINFREEIKLNYQQFFLFDIEWKIIGFGGQGAFLDLPRDRTDNEETNLKKSVLDIGNIDLGGTYDAQALDEARKFFTEEDIKEIKKEITLGIVLEITDGETESKNQSRKLVTEINKAGIFCRGIQIPELGISTLRAEEEREKRKEREEIDIFKEVWGENGCRIEYLEELPAIVTKLLEEAITIRRK